MGPPLNHMIQKAYVNYVNFSYKCPRHHRTKNCELLFIFPAAQLAAACRAIWYTYAKVLPQLKFVISLPPSAWFGRRGAPGIDSAESRSRSYAEQVARRPAEDAPAFCVAIIHAVTEAEFQSRPVIVWVAESGM